MEKTLILIKPDAMNAGNAGSIIKILEDSGFSLIKSRILYMTDVLASRFYVEHVGKDFYPTLLKFMQSGDIMALVLQKEDAVCNLRQIIGATDSCKAAPGTIRNLFGNHYFITSNAVHASDCLDSAKREIGILFPEYKY